MADPRCAPLHWRDDIFKETQSKPLAIGLIVDDGVVKVHPPIRRCLLQLADRLKVAGHEIVPWSTEDHARAIEIMDAYFTVDGGEDVKRDVMAGGEPFIPHIEALVNRGKPISVYEYWQLNKKKIDLQKRYLDRWNNTRSPSGRPIDVLLTPTMPHTALPHKSCRWVGYTKVWNLLDYSALSFPAGQVDKTLDKLDEPYQPRNPIDEWNWQQYDAEMMDGHPVSLQIVGRKLEEEKILGAAVVLENILHPSN